MPGRRRRRGGQAAGLCFILREGWLVGWFWGALLPRTTDPTFQRILMPSPYPNAGLRPIAYSSYTLAQWLLVKNRFRLRRSPDHGTARVVLVLDVVVV